MKKHLLTNYQLNQDEVPLMGENNRRILHTNLCSLAKVAVQKIEYL